MSQNRPPIAPPPDAADALPEAIIYLSRQGKVEGPFTEAAIRELRASGALAAYTYLCRGPGAPWEPVEAAPPAAPVAPSGPASSAPAAADASSVRAAQARLEAARHRTYDRFEILAHDFRATVSGRFVAFSENGADLRTEDPASGACFEQRARVVVNFLEPRSGRGINALAEVHEVFRRDGRWHYRLRWGGESPDELLEIAAA